VKTMSLSSSFSSSLSKKLKSSAGNINYAGISTRHLIHHIARNDVDVDFQFDFITFPTHLILLPVEKSLITEDISDSDACPWKMKSVELKIKKIDIFYKQRSFR